VVFASIKLKFYDRKKRTTGEDNLLAKTDTKELKHGEQTGLETPVVHALTYEGEMLEIILVFKLTH